MEFHTRLQTSSTLWCTARTHSLPDLIINNGLKKKKCVKRLLVKHDCWGRSSFSDESRVGGGGGVGGGVGPRLKGHHNMKKTLNKLIKNLKIINKRGTSQI